MFNTFSIHSNTFFIVKGFICYFPRNSLNGFKNSLQQSDITQRALQLWCTSNLHHMVESYWKIHLKIFSYTFPTTFWLWLHLHLQFLKKLYILSWRFQQQCCSAWWDLSFAIHIGGGPGVVFNFTVSNSGEGGIEKLTLDSDSRAPTTPGTIEKGQKFDYE